MNPTTNRNISLAIVGAKNRTYFHRSLADVDNPSRRAPSKAPCDITLTTTIGTVYVYVYDFPTVESFMLASPQITPSAMLIFADEESDPWITAIRSIKSVHPAMYMATVRVQLFSFGADKDFHVPRPSYLPHYSIEALLGYPLTNGRDKCVGVVLDIARHLFGLAVNIRECTASAEPTHTITTPNHSATNHKKESTSNENPTVRAENIQYVRDVPASVFTFGTLHTGPSTKPTEIRVDVLAELGAKAITVNFDTREVTLKF